MKQIILLVLLTVFILILPIHIGSDPHHISLPLLIPDEEWHPLRESEDAQLRQVLEKQLTRNKLWASLIQQRKMAVGLVDLTNPAAPKFAHINGNEMMYAASLPKIAVLLAACESMEEGTLKESPRVAEDLHNMIRYSDNRAATRLIDYLGFQKIESILCSPKYKLYDPDKGGGLWVGKRYAKTGGRHPDPVEGLSHAATVDQVCRFYYLLATARLINPERSREMLSVLSQPAIHHKFVRSLNAIAPDAQLYRKSGTWRNWHSDSVLVWEDAGRHYILVGLIEHPRGSKILEELVPLAENVLYH
jgi:beta-lactamase class A